MDGGSVTLLALSIPSHAEASEGTCDVDSVTEYSGGNLLMLPLVILSRTAAIIAIARCGHQGAVQTCVVHPGEWESLLFRGREWTLEPFGG